MMFSVARLQKVSLSRHGCQISAV